jgi:hypothetical protein
MPRKDGTGPSGNGPKKTNQGTPTPKRIGGAGGNRTGQGRGGSNRGRGRPVVRNSSRNTK